MKKLRLGLIGLGSAGLFQYHAARSVRGIEFVVGAESGEVRERVDIPVHKDWRRLLEDPSIDAVSIALPHHLHLEVACAAFDTGKHVLLEKPIARNATEARRIVNAARKARRVLMIEMTHHFYPPVIAGRELVRSGRLGQIYAVEERIIECGAAGRLPKWLTTTKLAGGGVALTNGIHMIDRTAWVCGQPLRFHDGVASWSQKIGDIEDTAAMQLSLANGTPVHFLASWPRRDGRIDDELTVYGTKGTLRIWAWRGWRFEPTKGEPEEHRGYKKGIVPAMIGMGGALQEFAAAIDERRKPSPSPEEILTAHELIDQFYKRVRRNKS
jgi:predicted dehydrogenase